MLELCQKAFQIARVLMHKSKKFPGEHHQIPSPYQNAPHILRKANGLTQTSIAAIKAHLGLWRTLILINQCYRKNKIVRYLAILWQSRSSNFQAKSQIAEICGLRISVDGCGCLWAFVNDLWMFVDAVLLFLILCKPVCVFQSVLCLS